MASSAVFFEWRSSLSRWQAAQSRLYFLALAGALVIPTYAALENVLEVNPTVVLWCSTWIAPTAPSAAPT
jgi:hypothetical protein